MKAQQPELNPIYRTLDEKQTFRHEAGMGSDSMKSVADLDAAFVSIPDIARCSLGSETLSKLISVAAATLYSDRATARACIERAAELLSVSDEARPASLATAIRGGLAPWQQKTVAEYVSANIGSTIRVRDLARVARLSVGHFFRAFRESFGEPPFAHIARQRIQHAQSLMLSSRASLSQIAFDCGMCDQAHFTRVFRRIVGINPGVWRRQSSSRNVNTKVSSSITARHLSSIQDGSLHIREG
jgi:AraC family transcriptional regulator